MYPCPSPEEMFLRRERVLLAQARRGLKRNGLKEYEAVDVIKRAINECRNQLTLGWSGGKCSTIVLHITLKLNPNIQVVYNNTGVEFPENVEYVHHVKKLWNVNLTELHPDTTFWKIVKKHGFPTYRTLGGNIDKRDKSRSRIPKCCHLLKEKKRLKYYKDNNILGDISGLRASESRVRAIHIGQRSQIYTVKTRGNMNVYVPIALWTKEMCEQYLSENQIPYNKTYDTQNRNGCWPCTAYKGWEKNILKYNPRMYRTIQKLRKVKLMEDYLTTKNKFL